MNMERGWLSTIITASIAVVCTAVTTRCFWPFALGAEPMPDILLDDDAHCMQDDELSK